MIKLPQNTNLQGRVTRFIIGVVLTSFAFWGPSNPWFLLGLIPIAVSVTGWCPLYSIFNIAPETEGNTTCCCDEDKKKDGKEG